MSVYEKVTEAILARLEAGVVPWKQPWKNYASGSSIPVNLSSKKPYRGINPFVLAAMGRSTPFWLSYKQAQAMGGQVRKGEKGSPVMFWKWKTHAERMEDLAAGRNAPPCYPIGHTVFNLDQIDGIEPPTVEKLPEVAPIEACEKIVAEMQKRPDIQHTGPRACYKPAQDRVEMPVIGAFRKPEDYYSVLFHELTHATGHESRLNRDGITAHNGFGSEAYGKEELVAEMGAAFICGFAGIEPATIDMSAAYLDNWIKAIRGDKTLLIRAGAQAQKAADFILGIKHDQATEDGK